MRTKNKIKNKSLVRKLRVRHKIKRNNERCRLCIHRSNRYIYGQIIDSGNGRTIIGISSKYTESNENDKKGKIDLSYRTGMLLAQKAKAKKIDSVVFDRGGFKYHGRVKAFAEGARKAGLKF